MTIEELKSRKYKMQYGKECNHIMNNLVPARGQADSLQGELLRELEKLRYEAQNNGNQNWDEWFVFFCDHIKAQLCSQSIFSDEEKQTITEITDLFKSCGEYVTNVVFNDSLPEDYPIDPDKIAYVEDNLYDYIADKIGKLYAHHIELIEYDHDPDMYR